MFRPFVTLSVSDKESVTIVTLSRAKRVRHVCRPISPRPAAPMHRGGRRGPSGDILGAPSAGDVFSLFQIDEMALTIGTKSSV